MEPRGLEGGAGNGGSQVGDFLRDKHLEDVEHAMFFEQGLVVVGAPTDAGAADDELIDKLRVLLHHAEGHHAAVAGADEINLVLHAEHLQHLGDALGLEALRALLALGDRVAKEE